MEPQEIVFESSDPNSIIYKFRPNLTPRQIFLLKPTQKHSKTSNKRSKSNAKAFEKPTKTLENPLETLKII